MSKKMTWAEIVHNVLMLKNFTLDHLRAVTCVKDVECEQVLSELERDGFVEFLGDMYHLTMDIDKRFDLLAKERHIFEANDEQERT